jgi:hypothetical protein
MAKTVNRTPQTVYRHIRLTAEQLREHLTLILWDRQPKAVAEAAAKAFDWAALAAALNESHASISRQLRRIDRNQAVIEAAQRFSVELDQYEKRVSKIANRRELAARDAVRKLRQAIDQYMPTLDPYWSPHGSGHIGDNPPWRSYAVEVGVIVAELLKTLYPTRKRLGVTSSSSRWVSAVVEILVLLGFEDMTDDALIKHVKRSGMAQPVPPSAATPP